MFFFFKQKTAYEMRIIDWSSDLCSSDLKFADRPPRPDVFPERPEREAVARQPVEEILSHVAGRRLDRRPDAARRVVQRLVPEVIGIGMEIGRASCRERVGEYG